MTQDDCASIAVSDLPRLIDEYVRTLDGEARSLLLTGSSRSLTHEILTGFYSWLGEKQRASVLDAHMAAL